MNPSQMKYIGINDRAIDARRALVRLHREIGLVPSIDFLDELEIAELVGIIVNVLKALEDKIPEDALIRNQRQLAFYIEYYSTVR